MDTMKINSIKVKKLNRRLSGEIFFNKSINILTGENGSGKTTILKACWYIYSGNIKKIFQEIEFEEIEFDSDRFKLSIKCNDFSSEEAVYSISISDYKHHTIDINKFLAGETFQGKLGEIEEAIWKIGLACGITTSSIFFPTFRRVEGGFAVGPSIKEIAKQRALQLSNKQDDALTKALTEISTQLSNFENHFVCSVSTSDIEKLVADTERKITNLQKQEYEALAGRISDKIRHWKIFKSANDSGETQLEEINEDVIKTEEQRARITEPMRSLDSAVRELLSRHKIKIGNSLFGQGVNEIDAALLSAGEKQLMSFLCYAALNDSAVYMVDEPELSLHLDWQRKLVSALSSLGQNKQYFFVTHSPAIYTKYSDCEVPVDNLLKQQ